MSKFATQSSLSFAEGDARLQKEVHQARFFALLVMWFKATAVTVVKEASARQKLLPYVAHLNHLAMQQKLVRDEVRSRKSIKQDEVMNYLQFAMFRKQIQLQLRYLQDRDAMYRTVFLLPGITQQGEAMLVEHAGDFRRQVMEQERSARYSLKLTCRVEGKEAVLATVRGDLERQERHHRGIVLAEWEVDWIALFRTFRLEDSMFQLERFILAQGTVKRDEHDSRHSIREEESCYFTTMIVSEAFAQIFADMYQTFLMGTIAVEVTELITKPMFEGDLMLIAEVEQKERFDLEVIACNEVQRVLDAADEAKREERERIAATRIQSFARSEIINKARFFTQQKKVRSAIDARVAFESANYESELRRRREAALPVLERFVMMRLSVKNWHEKHREKFFRYITRFTEAFLTRKDLFDVWSEEQALQSERYAAASSKLAGFVQRMGRGWLVREEVCDLFMDELEIRRSRSVAERQRRHIAALAIQWMHREWKLRRLQEENVANELLLKIRTRAAVKIQSVARMMFARQFYTLLLLPRYRLKKLLILQRVLRGCVARRQSRLLGFATTIQRFVHAFQSRRSVTEARVTPQVKVIQKAVRMHQARVSFERRLTTRRTREVTRAKAGYAVMMQALVRGFLCRRRLQEAQKITQQVRFTMLECDASDLEDDIWRIGRGFLARRLVWAKKQKQQQALSWSQAALRCITSQFERVLRQEQYVEALCRDIMNKRLSRVQAVLRQRLSVDECRNTVARNEKRNLFVRQFQRLLGRIHSSFQVRISLSKQFQRRTAAGSTIHSFVRGMRTRSELRAAHASLLATRAAALRKSAAIRICRVARAFLRKRRISATTIQRSLVLRYRIRMSRLSEVNEVRRSLYQLHIASLKRQESMARDSLVESECMGRHSIVAAFTTTEVQDLRDLIRASQPTLIFPDKWVLRESKKRCDIERDAVLGLVHFRDLMSIERDDAIQRQQSSQISRLFSTVSSSAFIIADRIKRDEHNTWRSMSQFFRLGVCRAFIPKFKSLSQAETSDRRTVEEDWVRECEAGLQRAHVALLTLVKMNQSSKFEIEDRPLPKKGAEVLDPKTRQRQRIEAILAAPLHRFQIPADRDKPTDISDQDLVDIFGDAAALLSPSKRISDGGEAASRLPVKKSVSARVLRTESAAMVPRPSSHDVQTNGTPRLLPPMKVMPQQQVSDALRKSLDLLQPPPVGSTAAVLSASAQRRDVNFAIEKAKDEIIVTADGFVDTSALGPELTDDILPTVVAFVRSKIVSGLVLPHASITPKGMLHLLRVCRAMKSPLQVIDISHNVQMNDVVGDHLVDLIGHISTLSSVNVTATAISPPKRLLLFHLLEGRAAMTSNAAPNRALEPGTALQKRTLVPLQVPRRNGWATEFAKIVPAPDPSRTQKIYEAVEREEHNSRVDW